MVQGGHLQQKPEQSWVSNILNYQERTRVYLPDVRSSPPFFYMTLSSWIMEGKVEAKGLSVRGFLWFSAAEPRATSSLGITQQHLCQTGRPQEQTPPCTGQTCLTAVYCSFQAGPLVKAAAGASKVDSGKNKKRKFPPLTTGADFVPGHARKGRVGSCSACSWTFSLTTTLFLPVPKTSLQLKTFRPAECQTCANLCSL